MKKFVSTLLVFALMFVLSTSAFASKGYADTKETAVELNGLSQAGSFLDYQNSDFYKYTNNTGRTIVLNFVVEPQVSFINYDIRGYFPNGDILTAKDQGAGNKDIIYDVELQPGEVIYLEIKGHTVRDFGRDAPYRIYYL